MKLQTQKPFMQKIGAKGWQVIGTVPKALSYPDKTYADKLLMILSL